MSVAAAMTALREVLAAAVGAKAAFDNPPAGQALALPAVVVVWKWTTPQARLNLGHNPATKKWQRTAVRNTHVCDAWVILSTTQAPEAEGTAIKAAGQSVMDALKNDATLRASGTVDRCVEARVRRIEPYRDLVSDTVVYAGVHAEVEIDEEG